VSLISAGDDPARRLALRLLDAHEVPLLYGLLYLENVAHCLFHLLGPSRIERMSGQPLSLEAVVALRQPRARLRWVRRLRRELRAPYGDDAVFAALEQHQKSLDRLLAEWPMGSQAWLYGSVLKGTFSPASDLDVALRAKPECRARNEGPWSELGLSLFWLPPGQLELYLCGPTLSLPGKERLPDLYLRVLAGKGCQLSPRPRVLAWPMTKRRREVPLWLEDGFKQLAAGHRGWRALRQIAAGLPLNRWWVNRFCPCAPPSLPDPWPASPMRAALQRMSEEADVPGHERALAAALARLPLADQLQVAPEQPPARLLFTLLRYRQADWTVAWVEQHLDELQGELRQRTYQVQPLLRSFYLKAGLSWIQRQFPGRSLALIDVGCGAGLQLLFDVPLSMTCLTRGQPPEDPPRVVFRVGLDRNPLSVESPSDCEWLLAHHSAEKPRKHLGERLEQARQNPPRVVRGLAEDCLPQLLAEVPAGAITVVYHSHLVHQMPPESQLRLQEHLQAVVELSLEWHDGLAPRLQARIQDEWRLLGVCPHGELHWLDRPAPEPQPLPEFALKTKEGLG